MLGMKFSVAQASHCDFKHKRVLWGMRGQSSLRRAIALPACCIGLALAPVATNAPNVLAHQTQISDGVGGTHHIEPNDTPRAGEQSQTWFALTQAGGTAIGLSDCDCKLMVVSASGEAIAQPSLSAIAVEGLTDVPAAEIEFPNVGAYVLQLSGEPKGEATFSPFQLDFPITVAAGQAVTESAAVEPESVSDSEPSETALETEKNEVVAAAPEEVEAIAQAPEQGAIAQPWTWALAGAGLGVLGVAAVWRRRRA